MTDLEHSFQPYPEYKDSSVAWLGEIPAHWRMLRAKRLFQKMSRPVRAGDEVVTCFRDGIVTLRKNRRLTGFTESLQEIGYQGIRRGDLVIHAMDAFAGAIGVSDSDGKGTPVYAVCKPAEEANAYYYAYIIREMARSQWLLALARGIRERSTDFRFDGFASQSVPVPPLDEQQAIVRFINHIDHRVNRFIRAKRRLITLLNEQKQAIIQHAVTRGLDPHMRLKPSGVAWLGDVPEHWGVTQIRSVARIVRGGSPRPAGSPLYFFGHSTPWITVAEITKDENIFLLSTSTYLTELGTIFSRVIDEGTLLLTNSGATLGVPKISRIKGCINDGVAAFLNLKPNINKEFLYFYLTTQTKHLRSWVNLGAQPNLNTQIIGGWPIVLPPLLEQSQVLEYIKQETANFSKFIERVQREIDLIREYRTRLIADVVTGKLDVRGVALSDDLPIDDPLLSTDELADDDDMAFAEEPANADD